MNKKKSVLNIITDVSGKLITLVIGIILPKLYIDSFGSDINGLLSSISNILVYVNLLEAGVGGASTQALYKAIGQHNTDDINGILAATDKFYKKTGIYFFSIVCILAFLYPIFVESSLDFFLVVVLILLSAVPSAIKYFFQGKYTILLNADNRAYILNMLFTITTVVTNISKIILIYLGCNIILIQIIYAILNLFQMLFIVLYIKYKYKYINLSVTPNQLAINKKKYVMVHTISSTIFSNVDILVLTFFTDLKIVSVYTVYNMVFNQINQIVKSLSNGMNASFGVLYYVDRNRYKKEYIIFSVVFRMIAFIFITITGILIIPFLRIYAASFQDANYIDMKLAILFLMTNLLDVVRWPEVLGTNTAGKFQETAKSAIIEASINLICSILFVLKFGMYGVLIATTVALLYRTVDMIHYVSKYIIKKTCFREFTYIIAAFIGSILLVLYSDRIICTVNNYVEFLGQALKGSFVVLLVHFIISMLFFTPTYLELIRLLKLKLCVNK